MSKEKLKNQEVEVNHKHIITDKMNFGEIMYAMSEGKPATLLLFSKLIQQIGKSGLIECLTILDTFGIYGSSIWKIYVENCEHNTTKFLETVFFNFLGLCQVICVSFFKFFYNRWLKCDKIIVVDYIFLISPKSIK